MDSAIEGLGPPLNRIVSKIYTPWFMECAIKVRNVKFQPPPPPGKKNLLCMVRMHMIYICSINEKSLHGDHNVGFKGGGVP